MNQVAERAVTCQFQCAAGDRMEQVVKSLHHGDARGVGRRSDPLRLRAVASERLLGQHRLTRRDCRQIPRRVQRIGQRVVHDVDFGIIDHFVVGRQNAFHAVLFGEQSRPLRVTRRDGDQLVAQVVCRADDGQFCDPRRAEYSDPQAHAEAGAGTAD